MELDEPAAACSWSANAFRLPPTSYISTIPVGGLIVIDVLEELIATPPINIALGTAVVTAPTVPDVAEAPHAEVAVAASGEVLFTPE